MKTYVDRTDARLLPRIQWLQSDGCIIRTNFVSNIFLIFLRWIFASIAKWRIHGELFFAHYIKCEWKKRELIFRINVSYSLPHACSAKRKTKKHLQEFYFLFSTILWFLCFTEFYFSRFCCDFRWTPNESILTQFFFFSFLVSYMNLILVHSALWREHAIRKKKSIINFISSVLAHTLAAHENCHSWQILSS